MLPPLHLQSSAEPDEPSPPLPDNVTRVLRLQRNREPPVLDKPALEGLRQFQSHDSNQVLIGRLLGTDVIADGDLVLQRVMEGLERRLANPLAPREELRLVGTSNHEHEST